MRVTYNLGKAYFGLKNEWGDGKCRGGIGGSTVFVTLSNRRGRNVHMWLNNGDKQSVVLASGDTLGAGTLIIGKGNTGTCFKGTRAFNLI